VEPVHLSRALFDQQFPVRGEVAEVANGFGRDEAAAQQAVLEDLGDPTAVLHIGLAPRDVLVLRQIPKRTRGPKWGRRSRAGAGAMVAPLFIRAWVCRAAGTPAIPKEILQSVR